MKRKKRAGSTRRSVTSTTGIMRIMSIMGIMGIMSITGIMRIMSAGIIMTTATATPAGTAMGRKRRTAR